MRHVPGYDQGCRGYNYTKQRQRKDTGSSITNVEDDRGGEDKDKTLDPLLDWILDY